jgi:hypothetical protein
VTALTAELAPVAAELDWVTISALATAAGTLVLAIATFASVRSANRAARAAERSLLEGLRPVLVTSRLQDPPEKVVFVDEHWVQLPGGFGSAEVGDEAVYLAIALRNVGRGLAVLDGWWVTPGAVYEREHAPLEEFRRLTRDLYIAGGDLGFWQGALRDPTEKPFREVADAVDRDEILTVELLYGDHEGGQRMVTRFALRPVPPGHEAGPGKRIAAAARHWHLDAADPR